MRLRPHLRHPDVTPGAHHDGLALFSVLWALASVWHVLGNPQVGEDWAQGLLVVGAGLVLWRPGAVAPLALLAVAGVATVWLEAPALGNHWLLAGFINLTIVLAVITGVLRGRPADRADLASRVFPAARLCLLAFYAFAAIAKLNEAFFDPDVSCAVLFFEQSTDSLGLSALQLDGAAWLERSVILGSVAVELAIPVLLLGRRTRNAGVVLGLAFHGLVAVDHAHQFYDFSSVLAPLFLLFLPSSAGTWVAERVGSARARLALADERLPGATQAGLAVLPTAAGLAVVSGLVDPKTAFDVGWVPWQVLTVVLVVGTVRYLRQRPPAATPRSLRPHHAAFLLVPALVVGNGLTPYLELKTGYGWNMYANLRTVDGDSNHLLVRRTFPLTDEQSDLVRIISTDDAALQRYASDDYALTWRQLQTYLAAHPGVQITYERGNATVGVQRASDRPELVAAVPAWREKVQLFRAVDERSPERCVPAFGPAR